MQTISASTSIPRRRLATTTALSLALHAALITLAAGVFVASPHIAPYRLPGTAHGVRTLTYFAPGSPTHAATELATDKTVPPPAVSKPALAAPKPPEPSAPGGDPGLGTASASGLGSGDVTIALETFFPYPKPDLSTLAHGTKGDIILDAVIDEHGNVSELTLLSGLTPAINDDVIATVKQWTYTPAKKNGQPVPSERELHFHFERG